MEISQIFVAFSEYMNFKSMFFFFRNIPRIIASFLWLGLPMVSYWFIYCEKVHEESFLIWHLIIVFDIITTLITFLSLPWIFCSTKPSNLEGKIFYEMKDYNGNFSQTTLQNCNFCTKAPRYPKKRQNNLCTQS